MPTGYTAGIIDGKIKTFKQFATQCMRAFGATIHMKEDSLSKPYTPRVPDGYYTNTLADAKKKLERVKKTTDAEIIKDLKKELLSDKKHNEDRIAETLKAAEALNKIQSEVRKWTPPTSDHYEFKEFMREQIETTIEHDASTKYNDDQLYKIQLQLNELNDIANHKDIAEKQRKLLIEMTEEDIIYYTKRLQDEVDRCNESNKWVTDLLDSI